MDGSSAQTSDGLERRRDKKLRYAQGSADGRWGWEENERRGEKLKRARKSGIKKQQDRILAPEVNA